ncbi:MAG: hypothetical protein HC848_00625 [Limnobacter sp.]|nr:hypothetical protein [Limnobacter sp.]
MLAHNLPANTHEWDLFRNLAWFEDSWPSLFNAALSTGASGLGMLTGDRNSRLMHQVMDTYTQYKAGKITKGQYDYARRQTLNTLKNKLGPMEKILFKGKSTHEALRIARSKAIPATEHIARHANRFRQVSRLASRSSVILAGAGLAMACRDIGNTHSRLEQNEIMVESVISSLAGFGGGYLVLFLITGPIGVGAALVLSAAVSAGAWGTGVAIRNIYTTYGTHLDFAGSTGIRALCSSTN